MACKFVTNVIQFVKVQNCKKYLKSLVYLETVRDLNLCTESKAMIFQAKKKKKMIDCGKNVHAWLHLHLLCFTRMDVTCV